MNKEGKDIKRQIKVKDILFLQGAVIIYTLSGVAAKIASGYSFLSSGFILFYGVEILILGIYALLWQQIIKRIDLSVAYANRAMSLLWSMVWAVVFFKESMTIKNIIGVLIVLAGTMIVNNDEN
ncbi:EamA family transporter [Merdimonas faecis]|uniref:EamA family transporter n=1 Tax=Merdimonas faecis TaxID=1653435 RepID=UPI0023FA098E|nr:EamA family transporter [Merdimonas faecis]